MAEQVVYGKTRHPVPPGDRVWRLCPSTDLELPAPFTCSHPPSPAGVTVSLPVVRPSSALLLPLANPSSAPHQRAPPVKPAWPSRARGFSGSPLPVDTAAPGSGPCPHTRYTEQSAHLRPLPFSLPLLGLMEVCPPQQHLVGVPPRWPCSSWCLCPRPHLAEHLQGPGVSVGAGTAQGFVRTVQGVGLTRLLLPAPGFSQKGS